MNNQNMWDHPPLIIDFDKVKEEWLEETKGMSDLEKAKYLFKKISDHENQLHQ